MESDSSTKISYKIPAYHEIVQVVWLYEFKFLVFGVTSMGNGLYSLHC